MTQRSAVPLNPKVLTWAIEHSGLDRSGVARRLNVDPADLNAWTEGTSRPGKTQFHELVKVLKRSEATFFLPHPPASAARSVAFCSSVSAHRTALNAQEFGWLREATRLHDLLNWLTRALDAPRSTWLAECRHSDPTKSAALARQRLGVDVATQCAWKTDSAAFSGWRQALAENGVFVFAYSLGEDSCRGFSLPGEDAATAVVNTAFNISARIYTAFHELAHLIRGDATACFGGGLEQNDLGSDRDGERWCEEFAAAFLLPADDVKRAAARRPKDAALTTARSFAKLFKVSLRAALLRLIRLGIVDQSAWEAYRGLSDAKPVGGGGGEGRDRLRIRQDQLGRHPIDMFLRAVERDVLTSHDVVSTLDITSDDFFDLSRR